MQQTVVAAELSPFGKDIRRMLLEIYKYTDLELDDRKIDSVRRLLCEVFGYQFRDINPAEFRVLAYAENNLVAHGALVSRDIQIKAMRYQAYLLGGMCTQKENQNWRSACWLE